MSTTVSTDVAYVLKHLDEFSRDNRKRKHDFLVQYQDNEKLDGSNHLTKDETKTQPNVEVPHIDDRTFRTLIMVDPDAPSRDDPIKGPVLHWLVANFQESNLSDGRTLYSYNGPSPPAGSGPHRYLFLLYQSNDKIPERKFDTLQRLRFPLQQYVTDTQLGLLDVTYFTVDN